MKRPDAEASGHVTFGWFIVWSLCVIVASVVLVCCAIALAGSVSVAARTCCRERENSEL